MAKTKISEFSPTPGNNTDIDGINLAEGCAPSGINNAIRELMSQLKDFQAGTAGDSFNGPIGTTTAAAGAFTTLSASSTATLNTLASSGATLTGGTINNMAVGGTTAAAGSFTTLTTSSTVTHNAGTANGVAFLNGSKVLTTGSALTFSQSGGTFSTTFNINSLLGSATYKGGIVITEDDSAFTLYGGSNYKLLETQGFSTPNALKFYANSTEQMRLTSTGLGIGNSSPTAKLDVTGTAAISGNVTLSGGTANGVAYLNASKVLTTGSALTFSQSGGTFSTTFNINSLFGSATYKGGIVITEDDSAFTLYGGSNYKLLETQGFSTPNALKFYANSTEQMRLTSTGLGIGTSSPVSKLSVSGTNSGAPNNTLNGSWVNVGSSLSSGFGMRQKSSDPGISGIGFSFQMATVGGLPFEIYTADAQPLVLGTNATERARIDSSGNLIQTVNTTAATLTTNQTLTFSIVNNSLLRISVRGSDGTTRTATLALA